MSEIRISEPLTSIEHRLAACSLILEKKLHYPLPEQRSRYSSLADISTRVTTENDLADLFDAAMLVHDGEEIVGIGVVGTWENSYHFQSFILPKYRNQGLTIRMMKSFKQANLIPEGCLYDWRTLRIGAFIMGRTQIGVKLAALYKNTENHNIICIKYKWFIDNEEVKVGEYFMATSQHLGKTLVMCCEVITTTGVIYDNASVTIKYEQ